MITIEGVAVPRGAITRLAMNLRHRGERWVAHHLGHAIDKNLDSLTLTPDAAEAILAALQAEPFDELEPLRQRLLASR